MSEMSRQVYCEQVDEVHFRGASPHRRGMIRVEAQLTVPVAVPAATPADTVADLTGNDQGQPAFQFIRDVAVDWDTTRVLQGRIGDYVLVARKQKGAENWFVGAITDEEGRTFDVPLTFLTPGRRYVAEIYADGPGANWRDNPLPVVISRQSVTRASRLTLRLAPGGGQAIRIRPAR